MWSHQASVAINASPHDVWQVLVAIDRYPEWNRYATEAVGDLRVGGEVQINVPRQREKRGPVNNRVTEIVVDQRLCWRSLSWYKFLVYGIRCRHLEAQPDGTTVFREVETMHGPLAGVIRRAMAPQLLRGLQTECDSLKQEVERLHASVFETKALPPAADAVAPDGSDVRILLGLAGASMAQFELRAGAVSVAVRHRTVEEIWYFLSGRGEMWRRAGDEEATVEVAPGDCLTIPFHTDFQFRSIGTEPLVALGITMPPWPGDGEAIRADGPWVATVQPGPGLVER